MRTSRVSRETKRLFNRTSSPSTPRRSTRSLARFAYGAAGSSSPATAKQETPDIEDAVGASPRVKRQKRSDSEEFDISSIPKMEEDDDTKQPAPRRQRKPARRTTDAAGQVTVEPPSDWEAMYEAVRRMRAPGGAAYGAAVDTMGCERLADRNSSPKDQRFHTLIALMLSSQTKDTVTAVVMKKMQTELPAYKEGAPKGLNLDNVLAVEPNTLNQMIWAVGFHNNKTKYIKQAAEILRDKWNGDIPDSIEGLTSLPGVGPKMAYLCLSAAWNRTEGIGVDVHVHRITNMWGWHKTKNPEETRMALQSWLPKDRWREINGLLVGLGQAVCLPIGNKCGDCELGHKGLCKAADRRKVAEGLKRLKEEEKENIKTEVKGEHAEAKESATLVVKKEESDDKRAAILADVTSRVAQETVEPATVKTESIEQETGKKEDVDMADAPVKQESVASDVFVKQESLAIDVKVKRESLD